MVRAGVRIGENAIVGAKSVVQKDVPAHHVAAGQPAKSIAVKPGWEDVAEPVDAEVESGKEDRRIDRGIPDDVEIFDEFQRDLNPPGSE
jgi:maltose O-acetyltransferase